MVDKSSAGSISRAAFGPGVALALSKRVSRRDLASADSVFWRRFSDCLLGLNALFVIVVCEAAGSAALGGDSATTNSTSGSGSGGGENEKALWAAVVCMVGLALLLIVDLMHQVRVGVGVGVATSQLRSRSTLPARIPSRLHPAHACISFVPFLDTGAARRLSAFYAWGFAPCACFGVVPGFCVDYLSGGASRLEPVHRIPCSKQQQWQQQ